jgi:hypothetical protein
VSQRCARGSSSRPAADSSSWVEYSWKHPLDPNTKKVAGAMRWPTTCKTKPTGHRPKSVQPLRRERTAAAAGPRGIGILKDEALPH